MYTFIQKFSVFHTFCMQSFQWCTVLEWQWSRKAQDGKCLEWNKCCVVWIHGLVFLFIQSFNYVFSTTQIILHEMKGWLWITNCSHMQKWQFEKNSRIKTRIRISFTRKMVCHNHNL
jgi:hypothetical protein